MVSVLAETRSRWARPRGRLGLLEASVSLHLARRRKSASQIQSPLRSRIGPLLQ
jgi:hypothetical protein